jgi:hypothetical protein
MQHEPLAEHANRRLVGRGHAYLIWVPALRLTFASVVNSASIN